MKLSQITEFKITLLFYFHFYFVLINDNYQKMILRNVSLNETGFTTYQPIQASNATQQPIQQASYRSSTIAKSIRDYHSKTITQVQCVSHSACLLTSQFPVYHTMQQIGIQPSSAHENRTMTIPLITLTSSYGPDCILYRSKGHCTTDAFYQFILH